MYSAEENVYIKKPIHGRIKSTDSKFMKTASKKYKNVIDESIKHNSKDLSNKKLAYKFHLLEFFF